jgi:hypothetical protein
MADAEPIDQVPGLLPEVMTSAVQSVLEQARALGLTWTLRIGTVAVAQSDSLTVIFDGDTEPLDVVSLLGPTVSTGQRVYCLIIPPAGNFIVGTAGARNVPSLRATAVGFSFTAGSVTITWTSAPEQEGGFILSVPTTTIRFPVDGWYVINITLEMADIGIVNSIQQLAMTAASTVPGWANPFTYATNWSISSNRGTLAVSNRFNAGDTFTVAAFQNSVASSLSSCYLSAVWVAD